jgi:hypothetical protein
MSAIRIFVACAFAATLGGCGLFVPEKNIFPDIVDRNGISSEGAYENKLVERIRCETAYGLLKADNKFDLPWLSNWGTSITLTITAEDQSGLSPGVSSINPIGVVASMQSFTAGFGATGSANATRTETIQFTYANAELLKYARKNVKPDGTLHCDEYIDGVMLEGDLKIWEFIYDKAVIAAFGNATLRPRRWALYNTFTEEITFVASLGGNFTPTWKLTRISANTSGNFPSATRTKTNDLIISLGPLQTQASKNAPVQLTQSAQNQHNARVTGSATATSTQAQSH